MRILVVEDEHKIAISGVNEGDTVVTGSFSSDGAGSGQGATSPFGGFGGRGGFGGAIMRR